jgi:hypothetical protein
MSHQDVASLNELFMFPDTLVSNFRIQLLQLLTNLSHLYCMPYKDAAFVFDEIQASSDMFQLDFLMQLSNVEETVTADIEIPINVEETVTADIKIPINVEETVTADIEIPRHIKTEPTDVEVKTGIAVLKDPKKKIGSNTITMKKRKRITATTKRRSTAIDTAPADPFIGKAVAFGVKSDAGSEFVKEFGKKWVPDAICYHLDATNGRTVIGSYLATWTPKHSTLLPRNTPRQITNLQMRLV